MCGIVVVVGDASEEIVISMRDTMTHRGPDDCGLVRAGDAILAHRRLSIIDLGGGHQPLCNEDESIWISYNGEIYNYLELRKELERAGHRFKTRSDTEVIVHLYEERGERCPERLRGDFAFAIWDQRRKTLFAARDRLGVKPLFYAQRGDTLLVASEPKALLVHPDVSRELDCAALDQYLSYLYVPPPRTIYRQIKQLPPAHRMRFCGGVLTIERYWSPPLTRRDGPTELEDAAAEVREVFDDAVRVRLMSEVPLGAFLSGGMDSASLVAAMARASDRPIRTFTVRFPAADTVDDEGPAAHRIAKRLGTDHVDLEAQSECTEYFDEMLCGFDQPFGNPTSLLVYVLAKLTRQYVTVALAGDGGDELFGGYPRYRGLYWLETYSRAPRPLRQAVALAANRLMRDRPDGRHTRRRIREFLGAGALPVWEGYLSWIGYWDGYAKDGLYTDAFRAQLESPDRGDWLKMQVDRLPSADLLASASALDMVSFLPENCLAYSDRMTMAHSLEARVPFTDHLLIERVLPLRSALKWPGGQPKGLLCRAMADRLPAETLRGGKVGFNPPMAAWLRRDLGKLMDEYLSPGQVRRRGFFEVESVEALKRQLRDGARDASLHLWALIVLEGWLRRYVD